MPRVLLRMFVALWKKLRELWLSYLDDRSILKLVQLTITVEREMNTIADKLVELEPRAVKYRDGLIGDTVAAVRRAILTEAPDRMSAERLLREGLGVGAARASTIYRTERAWAVRERTWTRMAEEGGASRYRGWMWAAKLDKRTCPWCIFHAGKVFPLDERMNTHPNCRCVPRPVPLDMPESFSGTRLEGGRWQNGLAWFAEQPRKVQASIMPPSVLDALLAGRITWEQIIKPGGGRKGIGAILGDR